MGVAAGLAAAAVVGAVGSNVAANKASNAQKSAANTASAQVKQSTGQARNDLFKLFPSAQQAGQQGFQSALDVYGQSVPAQQQAFQGGNVAAQNQILAGLPQMQNALFGNQVDMSQFQAYNPQQQDLSFLNQQLPFTQQQNANNALNGQIGPLQQGQPSIYDQLTGAGANQTVNQNTRPNNDFGRATREKNTSIRRY